MTENNINNQEINVGIMKKGTRTKFFSAVGGAIVALSLTMLAGLVISGLRIQEYFGFLVMLIAAVIIGFYFIFIVANN